MYNAEANTEIDTPRIFRIHCVLLIRGRN
uniref:Uncharacterized protein n=1 Tax=Arundo donax TaxID=35708 RepID=A0A0A9EX76_ARUDO